MIKLSRATRERIIYYLFPHIAMQRRDEKAARVNKVVALVDFCDEAVRDKDYARAQSLYEEGLKKARAEGDPWSLAILFVGLGYVAFRQNNSHLAQSCFDESLPLFRSIDHKIGIAQSHLGLGSVALLLEQYPQARYFFQESLTEHRALLPTTTNKYICAGPLQLLGAVAARQGKYQEALSLYEESLSLYESADNKLCIMALLSNIGLVVDCLGDRARAKSLVRESLALARELDEKPGIVAALINLGVLAVPEGSNVEEKQYLEEALALSRGIAAQKSVSYALGNLGMIARYAADYPRALTYYKESLTIKRGLQDRWGIAYTLEGCADIAVARGAAERGVCLLGAADAIREMLGTPREPAVQADYDVTFQKANRLIDSERLTIAREQGRRMTWEQAVSFALVDEDSSTVCSL